MRIFVNGRVADVPQGASVGEVISGEPHAEGTAIALIRQMDKVQKGTDEFKVTTDKGVFIIKLNGSPAAKAWREIHEQTANRIVRLETSKVIAVGSFPTQLPLERGRVKYRRYDVFLSLGGFDNRTTYLMIARSDHEGDYGLVNGLIGHVTRGRHVLGLIREGDLVKEVVPVVMEMSSSDAYATTDMGVSVEEGMSVETFVAVELDRRSPVSAEHLLVTASKGRLRLTERTAAYTSCSSRLDVKLVPEHREVRQQDMVTVRADGIGTGRIYFYKQRRQVNQNHNAVGMVVSGRQLIHLVPEHSEVTLITRPDRILTVGMSQKEAQEFLASRGLKQARAGSGDDDSIVVEQEPELTLQIPDGSEVETLGVRPDAVRDIMLYEDLAPYTVTYLKKMTGLDHKPIGTMKVHFTFEGMPLITYEGNAPMASGLVPENGFTPDKGVAAGDLGVTNMSRPNRGLIGMRLEASSEFGPTGEEDHGTNIVGRMVSDPAEAVKGLKDGDIVYVRLVAAVENTVKKANGRKSANGKEKRPRAKKAAGTENKTKRRSSSKVVSDAGKD